MIAYFSMEIGLEPGMPTYAGGLGVLAADTIRSAADVKVPMVAMTLLHRKGYFAQRLDPTGWQMETPESWPVEKFLHEMQPRVGVQVDGRAVQLRCWRYDVKGISGFIVPAYFLDADVPENGAWDRALTDSLYGGDSYYRLCQEVLLGIGGVRMLRALGHGDIARFHMNEGHAALLALELLEEEARKAKRETITHDDVAAVQKRCIFTTHTPVPAGHDQFPMDLVYSVLGRREAFGLKDVFCCDGVLNLTFLALNLSHFINGVAKKHGEITQHMFARYVIDSITNGVHAATWTSQPFQRLFDSHIAGWRKDNFSLRYALAIPRAEIWRAHQEAKAELFEEVNRLTGMTLAVDVLTIGFARRAAGYKRADLFFADLDRLKAVAQGGRLQIIYAGKAHPRDQGGKEIIRRIFEFKQTLKADIRIVYLENYDLALARLVTSGVDLWLNTPEPPLEASGTSGMKAALNGVPSFSVLDGWWIEGWIEDVTGWAIGAHQRRPASPDSSADAASLYEKLERTILPLYHDDRNGWVEVMRHAIALNGSFFNTQRMVQQYVLSAYFL